MGLDFFLIRSRLNNDFKTPRKMHWAPHGMHKTSAECYHLFESEIEFEVRRWECKAFDIVVYQSQHEILDDGFKHLRQLFIIVSAFRWHLVLSFMLLALSSWFSILAVVAVVVLAITTEDKVHIHAQKT